MDDFVFDEDKVSNSKYVSFTDYKGNRMIELKNDYDIDKGRFGFKFGKHKARLIVKHFNAIKQFAEEE